MLRVGAQNKSQDQKAEVACAEALSECPFPFCLSLQGSLQEALPDHSGHHSLVLNRLYFLHICESVSLIKLQIFKVKGWVLRVFNINQGT